MKIKEYIYGLLVIVFIVLTFALCLYIYQRDFKEYREEVIPDKFYYVYIDYENKEERVYWQDDIKEMYKRGNGTIGTITYKIVMKDGTVIYTTKKRGTN